jgi:hypothetical protein
MEASMLEESIFSRTQVNLSTGRMPPIRSESDWQMAEKVDQTFLLCGPQNVSKYKERLCFVSEQLQSLGLTPQVIIGNPDGQALQDLRIDLREGDERYFVGKPGRRHHEAAVFGHLSVLQEIVKQTGDLFLVCEDDVLFHPDINSLISDFWDSIPKDFDIVYLGYSNPIREFETTLTECNDKVWKGAFWCLHCALITKQGAQKILDQLPIHDQIDFWYGRLAHEGKINSYAVRHLEENPALEEICSYTPRGFAYQKKD